MTRILHVTRWLRAPREWTWSSPESGGAIREDAREHPGVNITSPRASRDCVPGETLALGHPQQRTVPPAAYGSPTSWPPPAAYGSHACFLFPQTHGTRLGGEYSRERLVRGPHGPHPPLYTPGWICPLRYLPGTFASKFTNILGLIASN